MGQFTKFRSLFFFRVLFIVVLQHFGDLQGDPRFESYPKTRT